MVYLEIILDVDFSAIILKQAVQKCVTALQNNAKTIAKVYNNAKVCTV